MPSNRCNRVDFFAELKQVAIMDESYQNQIGGVMSMSAMNSPTTPQGRPISGLVTGLASDCPLATFSLTLSLSPSLSKQHEDC